MTRRDVATRVVIEKLRTILVSQMTTTHTLTNLLAEYAANLIAFVNNSKHNLTIKILAPDNN